MRFVLILATLFTSVSLPAQVPSMIDRKQLVRAAFFHIYDVFQFLGENSTFQTQLTDGEKIQYNKVFAVIAKHEHSRWAELQDFNFDPSLLDASFQPWLKQGGDELSIPLEFSNDQSIFKLNPSEPIRSAVTSERFSDPIYFNTAILNSPDVKLEYVEIFRLLTHEFGHKILAEKNQDDIDSMAVKLSSYIRKYYLETEFLGIKIFTLSFFYRHSHVKGMADRQSRFPVLIEYDGIIDYHLIDYAMLNIYVNDFRPIAGNADELISLRISRLLPPDITNVKTEDVKRWLATKLSVYLQVKSEVVLRDSYTNFTVSPGDRSALNPAFHYSPLLEEARFKNLEVVTGINLPTNHYGRQSLPQILSLRTGKSGELEGKDLTAENEVLAIEQKDQNLILVLKKSSSLEKLNVVFEAAGEREIEIAAKKFFENGKIVKFLVPQFSDRSFTIKRVTIPNKGYIFLNKPYEYKSPVHETNSIGLDMSPPQCKIGGKWIEFDPSHFENYDQDRLPLRFTFRSATPIEQIRLDWTVGDNIYLGKLNEAIGEIGLGATEIVTDFKVTHLSDNNFLVELYSQPQFLNSELRSPMGNVRTRDSGHRFLRRLRITTSDWKYKEIVYRSVTSQLPYSQEGLKLSERLKTSALPLESVCKDLFLVF